MGFKMSNVILVIANFSCKTDIIQSVPNKNHTKHCKNGVDLRSCDVTGTCIDKSETGLIIKFKMKRRSQEMWSAYMYIICTATGSTDNLQISDDLLLYT